MELWQHLERDYETEERMKDVNTVVHTHDEIWINNIYIVFLTKTFKGNPPNTPPMTWLSIKRHDKEPCNDWRHFQFIKNQLVGEECEAVQMYPAESRLVDGSNQYHLFCLKDKSHRFPFGFNEGRTITEHPFANGKQRSWPKNMKPTDLAEQNVIARSHEQKYRDQLNQKTGK